MYFALMKSIKGSEWILILKPLFKSWNLVFSGIHDHVNSHCFMKVIDGQVQETLYGWPVEGVENEKMKMLRKNVYGMNQVAYINGK